MKKKTKNIIKIAFAILLIVLIQAVGITYAKYMTSEKGSGRAEIANWSFEIVKDGQEIKNIQLINSVDKDTLVNGKIAPGTSGQFAIDIDGTGSEVDMDYVVEFMNEQNKPANITFSYGTIKTSSLSEIDIIEGHIAHDEPQSRRILIYWTWEYETGKLAEEIAANDILDTQDGSTLDEYTFDVVVTATQSE